MILAYLLLFLCCVLGFIAFKNKIYFDIPSFLRKSLPLKQGVFGVYCFTGKQGSGKTYSLNKFIRKHAKGKKIYSNVTLIDLDYTPLTSMSQMLSLIDEQDCYIVYDEIFTFMTKNTKFVPEIKEFLNQMRKQHMIFMTSAQEWLDLPIEFRRTVRIQVECSTRPLGAFGGILKEAYFNAWEIKWDNLENEYVSPIIRKKYSKYEKRFMILYDTEERIRPLPQ